MSRVRPRAATASAIAIAAVPGTGTAAQGAARRARRTKVFSGPRSCAEGRVPTVCQALSDRQLGRDSAFAVRKTKDDLALLNRETGVTDTKIMKVPVMYDSGFGGEVDCGTNTIPAADTAWWNSLQ